MPRKTYFNSRTRINLYVSEETEEKLNFIVNVLGLSKVTALELVINEYYTSLVPRYRSILDLANKEETNVSPETVPGNN